MKKVIILFVYITQTLNLFSQPIDKPVFINEAAYTKPFLHLVNDEKYFAKYAIEAQNGSLELMEPIKCKLHVPLGLNKTWQDAEKNNSLQKGGYDYSKDLNIGIRFNFYVGGVLVSTAYENFENSPKDSESFTYYFDLDPLDFSKKAGNINFAYLQFLRNIKKKGSQLVIEAALPSKNSDQKSYLPIAIASFYLRFDDTSYEKWMKSATDYNIQLKQLADSTMKSIFGEIGFSKNFTMTCLQNPCEKGYLYNNTMESDKPCSSEPQDICKEALVTYNFVKDVPLKIKMLVTIKDNGHYVYIENNPYGKKQISIEKQNLLSLSEIQKIIDEKYSKDSLTILPDNRALVYSHTRILQSVPEYKGKFKRESGIRLIKETKAGKNWENGFLYVAQSKGLTKPNRINYFDAVSGKLLWISETYADIDENNSH